MERSGEQRPLPYYDGEARLEWNGEPMAARLIPEDRPVRIELTGKCPRCRHDTVFRYPLVTVAEGVSGQTDLGQTPTESLTQAFSQLDIDSSQGAQDIDVWCRCGQEHPGDHRPDDAEGCGAFWVKFVSWSSS